MLLPALNGCTKQQQKAAPAPSSGYPGAIGTGGQPKRDAATQPTLNDEDAGGDAGPNGPLRSECIDIAPASAAIQDMPMGQLFNHVTSPTDFAVTRVRAFWEPSCAPPTLRIEMSGGSCITTSNDHALVFRLDAEKIRLGTIHEGHNPILGDIDAGAALLPDAASTGLGDGGAAGLTTIPISYTRPQSRSPSGTWGTCSGASGSLEVIGVPSTNAQTRLQATFDLDLTACDNTGSAPQHLAGSFNVVLRRGLSDVCRK